MNRATETSSMDSYENLVRWASVKSLAFRTERLEIVSSNGRKLAAYFEAPTLDEVPRGVVLIAPAYGETKEQNLLISSYLAANQFYSLRFDWSDHVGESEGNIVTSTLTKMQQDLLSLLDYLRSRFPSQKLGLFATSLAARVAIKVASLDKRVSFLTCFTPVINLRDTLYRIYREDLVDNYIKGRRYGTIDMLGLSIDADNFLNNAIESSFADFTSTQLDASKIAIPTVFVVGQRDSWVREADAQALFDNLNTRKKALVPVVAAMHRLLENPGAADAAIRAAIGKVAEQIAGEIIEVRAPNRCRVESQHATERMHLKERYEYSQTHEQNFWKTYLSNFSYVFNIRDFYLLLEAIHNRLGGVWSGQRILDAGCGLGNFGLYLLTKQLYRAQQDLRYANLRPVEYYGIDFVREALSEASHRICNLEAEFQTKASWSGGKRGSIEKLFILANLEAGIPFQSDFFDHVCCNLVISYLQDPISALRELWRVLRPGGKLVVSSLKPNADLSEIYRNFIAVAESPKEIYEGRQLLSNAGMIKIKEVAGIYHFYSEKELRSLVRKSGFYRAKTFRSFGNQANLVVCCKVA